jgi:hypothetical protein
VKDQITAEDIMGAAAGETNKCAESFSQNVGGAAKTLKIEAQMRG